MRQMFRRELRYAVRRKRLQIGVLLHGQKDFVSIYRRARGVDETLNGQTCQCFEETLSRLDVVRCIDVEVASPAFPDPGLRRQVENMGHSGQERLQIHLL
jgi:hypothetical protein